MRHWIMLLVSIALFGGSISASAAGSFGTPRERACKAVNMANTIRAKIAWDIACNFAGGPVAQKICEDNNPYPDWPEIKKNCIDCVLDEALGGEPCDESWGDPHFITRDGLRFNFHREGDYAIAVADDLEVQIRLTNPRIGYTAGVALKAGANIISVDDSAKMEAPIFVNSMSINMEPGDWYEISNPDGFVQKLGDGYLVVIPGYVKIGISGSRMTMQLSSRLAGQTQGLLGDGDGDASNDLKLADGTPVQYRGDEFYGAFKTDWQRLGDASLFATPFSYSADPADNTGQGVLALADLDADARRRARQTCIDAGVVAGAGLDECTYDLALTDDASLIDDTLALTGNLSRTVNAASLPTLIMTPIAITTDSSVSADVPATGAGRLENTVSIDRYEFAQTLTEPQLLVLSSPCDAAVSLTLLQRTGAGVLPEVLLDCDSPIYISPDVAGFDIFSGAGDTAEYAFDLSTPATISLGELPLDQEIQGTLSQGEMAVGTLSSAASNNIVLLSSGQDADCGIRWRVMDNNDEPQTGFDSVCNDLGLIDMANAATPFRLQLLSGSAQGEYSFLIRDPYQVDNSVEQLVAGDATLSAVATVGQGATINVIWTGPANARDYIAIASPGDVPNNYSTFAYLDKESNSVSLRSPGVPGTYEIRYILDARVDSDNRIIATQALVVTASDATLAASSTAPAGSELVVNWSGPNNERDFITIAKPEDNASTYEQFSYLAEGSNEVTLVVPGIPGNYELRYIVNRDRQILASVPITITPVTATLSAPAGAGAGSTIIVSWTGPANNRDFITIAKPEDRASSYENFSYLTEGSGEVDLVVPGIPGDYEIRYVVNSDRQIISSTPITVNAVPVTLSAPAQVVVGSDFDVQWTGPGNNRDFITIALPADTPSHYDNFSYVDSNSNTVSLRAPSEPGSFDVRYIINRDRVLVHSVPITVVAQ